MRTRRVERLGARARRARAGLRSRHAAIPAGHGPHRRRRPERLRGSGRRPVAWPAATRSSRRSTARSRWPLNNGGARRRDPGLASRDVTPHFAKDGGIWPVHCVAETWGADAPPGSAPPGRRAAGPQGRQRRGRLLRVHDARPASPARPPRPSSRGCCATPGSQRVVVVGLATDYCVKATALDAVRLGFETALLTDAIAAVDLAPGDGDRALDEMARGGRHDRGAR